MKKRWKYLILFIALSQLMMMLGLIILPPVVQALPGEMRVRIAKVPLGGALLDIGTTPMPTALPIPANAVAQARVEIPVVATPTTKPTETAVSASPPEKPEVDETIIPTNTPTETPVPTNTPTPVPLPSQARIEGVDIIAQGFSNCGPANLTINLNFYGDATTQTEAAAFLKPNREDRNVSPWQMVDYVNEQTDMRAFFGSGGDIELLKQLIAAGFPVVIEKGYELPREGRMRPMCFPISLATILMSRWVGRWKLWRERPLSPVVK